MPTGSWDIYSPKRAANIKSWENYYLSLGCGTSKAFNISRKKALKPFNKRKIMMSKGAGQWDIE